MRACLAGLAEKTSERTAATSWTRSGHSDHDETFDLGCDASEVIEHIPMLDTFLRGDRARAAAGGTAIISTEDGSGGHSIAAAVCGRHGAGCPPRRSGPAVGDARRAHLRAVEAIERPALP